MVGSELSLPAVVQVHGVDQVVESNFYILRRRDGCERDAGADESGQRLVSSDPVQEDRKQEPDVYPPHAPITRANGCGDVLCSNGDRSSTLDDGRDGHGVSARRQYGA